MIFFVDNEVDAKFSFDIEETAKKVAGEVLKSEGCPFDVQLSLLITDDEGIRQINSEFREIDSPTDVLSFPNISYENPGDFSAAMGEQKIDVTDPESGLIVFGDIVINENRVRQQAEEFGHSELREFAFLVAHSMLHLCGYDHMEEDEAKVMEEKQENVLQSLGITRD
ncbi:MULTISPECIES: rRNA maturation RNase YbeY [unclassified Butyrivibrio]|uniref:rRNA maturation RNase YbeY n=1 Tax=unclassified Butyrivibrio TaxID=2639466 RepID=UPI0004049098|nr:MULTISPECIES: rRNA maturation RNase YbeY [unclassified Butyrivibrio]SEK38584.1 probable rRNA maturation factor [Butyrivibrio sp. ob235]